MGRWGGWGGAKYQKSEKVSLHDCGRMISASSFFPTRHLRSPRSKFHRTGNFDGPAVPFTGGAFIIILIPLHVFLRCVHPAITRLVSPDSALTRSVSEPNQLIRWLQHEFY